MIFKDVMKKKCWPMPMIPSLQWPRARHHYLLQGFRKYQHRDSFCHVNQYNRNSQWLLILHLVFLQQQFLTIVHKQGQASNHHCPSAGAWINTIDRSTAFLYQNKRIGNSLNVNIHNEAWPHKFHVSHGIYHITARNANTPNTLTTCSVGDNYL